MIEEQSVTDNSRNKLDAMLRQQAAMARFGELALRSDDLEQILNEACRLAADALDTDLAKVMQLEDDGKTLLVCAGVGWKPGIVGHGRVEATEASSERHALSTGEPVTSGDIEREDRFTYADFIKEHDVRALVNVIIIGQRQQPFGIFEVDSRRAQAFDEADTDFLRG